MKSKKMVLIAMAVIGILGISAIHAYSYMGWYHATVTMAGPFSTPTSSMRINLTIGGATRAYQAPTGLEDQMLAVALTAITTNKKVYVYTDPLAPTAPILIKNMMLEQ